MSIQSNINSLAQMALSIAHYKEQQRTTNETKAVKSAQDATLKQIEANTQNLSDSTEKIIHAMSPEGQEEMAYDDLVRRGQIISDTVFKADAFGMGDEEKVANEVKIYRNAQDEFQRKYGNPMWSRRPEQQREQYKFNERIIGAHEAEANKRAMERQNTYNQNKAVQGVLSSYTNEDWNKYR